MFILVGWTWLAAVTRRRPSEVMTIGTDPILGVLVSITWRLFRPRARIIHWCHDMYPDATPECLAATGDRPEFMSPVAESVSQLRELDGGGRIRIDAGHPLHQGTDQESNEWWSGRYATLVPWALVEPPSVVEPSSAVREELFGSCRLGLLYSGNFGRAHHFDSLLRLARLMRSEDIGVCFAGRGMRLDSVRTAVKPDDDHIRIAGFSDESQLSARLAAADVHLVTLQPAWTGTVVPSKFFGALAAGRPVIFAGDRRSAIAQWIEHFGIGWILTDQSLERVADQMRALADDHRLLLELRQRCFDVYHSEFSRRVQIDRWQQVLLDKKDSFISVRRQLISNHPMDDLASKSVDEKELAAMP